MPANPAPYLTRWLFDIGPGASSAMGDAALGYRDFAAWQEISGVVLLPWEARMLRKLSIEYLNEKHEATRLDRPAPYTTDIMEARKTVDRKIKAAFAGLRQAKPSSSK